MECRMRSAVSRTAKGYSIEATLDMGETDFPADVISMDIQVSKLGQFQITKLQEHMEALGKVFPREDTWSPEVNSEQHALARKAAGIFVAELNKLGEK